MIHFKEISIHSQNILSVKLFVPFAPLWSLIGLDLTLFGSSSLLPGAEEEIEELDWKRLDWIGKDCDAPRPPLYY